MYLGLRFHVRAVAKEQLDGGRSVLFGSMVQRSPSVLLKRGHGGEACECV